MTVSISIFIRSSLPCLSAYASLFPQFSRIFPSFFPVQALPTPVPTPLILVAFPCLSRTIPAYTRVQSLSSVKSYPVYKRTTPRHTPSPPRPHTCFPQRARRDTRYKNSNPPGSTGRTSPGFAKALAGRKDRRVEKQPPRAAGGLGGAGGAVHTVYIGGRGSRAGAGQKKIPRIFLTSPLTFDIIRMRDRSGLWTRPPPIFREVRVFSFRGSLPCPPSTKSSPNST